MKQLKKISSIVKKEDENFSINGKEKLSAVFEVSNDFLFELDDKGVIIYLNDYGSSILDFSVSEILGKHFFDFISTSTKNSASKAFKDILHSPQSVSFNASLLNKFGKEFYFQFTCKALFNDGIITGIIGAGKNLNSIKALEEKINEINEKLIETNRLLQIERSRSRQKKALLDELNKMKNDFVSNISHELRTPLASIIGFSETISTDSEMSKELREEFNNVILNEGKRLANLINDVLDISKAEGNLIELSRSEFDVVKLLKEVIESQKEKIKANNIQFSSDIPNEKIFINADAQKIEQVFNELIDNALKFTKKSGRLTIFVQNLYKEVEIIISDTGIGIPDDDISHIFEKFYRVKRPGSEISGAGLGLVFVKHILDMHKGFIKIESELNKGTTCLIKLPKLQKI